MLDEQFAREFAERYADAWNSHDAELIEPLVTENIVWLDPALPEPARGVNEVKEFMRTSWAAFPDLHFTAGPMWLDPHEDSMTWAWRMEGTHTGPLEPPGFAPTGRGIDVDGIDVWDFADGRIDRYRAYYDMSLIARQLGLMPTPGSRFERVGVALQRAGVRAQARFARR
ncbi:MAG TPA: ester cyclase [Thermoleophilaceae bacterium]|jgi:steroid delta-isomerase-like uncharacterized protein